MIPFTERSIRIEGNIIRLSEWDTKGQTKFEEYQYDETILATICLSFLRHGFSQPDSFVANHPTD